MTLFKAVRDSVKSIPSWVLILVLLINVEVVRAIPEVSINTQYYPVTGFNSTQIRQSIQQSGPIGKDGRRYHANTNWKLSWSYRWIESTSVCRITQVDVSIDINYLLPKHQHTDNLPQELKTDWENFFQALFRHEQQHKTYGVEAARELELKLLQIDQQLSCSRLDDLVSTTAQEVLDKYDRLERDYDRITGHGLNQGVVLP